MKTRVFMVILVLLLCGCTAKKEDFNETEFYQTIDEGILNLKYHHHSIRTNLEFSERTQSSLKVLDIELYSESDDVNDELYQTDISNLRNQMDVELLRTNYDLIQISFLSNKGDVLYEYVNMANMFALGDSVLSKLEI